MRLSCYLTIAAAAMAGLGISQPSTGGISSRAAARLLDQASWGPTPASIAQVQQMGIGNWLEAQFALNPSDLPDQPVLNSSGKVNGNLKPVQAAFFANAVSGQDQLRQRVAFALSQIWVVSAASGVRPAYAYPPYWRIFRDHAFGDYRDLIRAVTLSPAMGRYLNMANNNKANAAKGTAANENYARELLQLFTLGLNKLNPDGTAVVDQNNNPVPTYDQAVVTSLARVLTGWTYPTEPGAAPRRNNPPYFIGEMFSVPAEHDTSSKNIFDSIAIPAGQTPEQDLKSLLDALMAQTAMAPFVSKQLIQHLVTSNPSPAYVRRVANVFLNDGTGGRGNLQAVVRAILTDPEARAGDEAAATVNPTFGHMREPILFMTNLLRGLNGKLSVKSIDYGEAAGLGENLFFSPSVFSYFSPQYRLASGVSAPEFQIYTTATSAGRANIVNSILYGKLDQGTTFDLSPFEALAGETGALLNSINYIFLHGSMSRALTQSATSAVDAAPTPQTKALAALYVVLTSGEYQIIQ